MCGRQILNNKSQEGRSHMFKQLTSNRTIALIFAIVLCAGLLTACGGGGYTKLVDQLFDGIRNGSGRTVFAIIAPERLVDEQLRMTADQSDGFVSAEEQKKAFLEDLDESLGNAKSGIEESFGRDAKISYKVVGKHQLSKDDLPDIAEVMNGSVIPAGMKIQDAYILDLEVTIKGSKDSNTDDMTLTVIKIDGKWYLSPDSFRNLGF